MGNVTDVQWSNPDGLLSLSASGGLGKVQILHAYSGTATVKCTWKYTLYYGDTAKSMSKYWSIKCTSNDVSISPTNVTMTVGQTIQLNYSHKMDKNVHLANAYFSSSSQNISVTRDGRVTALKEGPATVNVYSNVSTVSPYCSITIKDVKPTSVSIPPSKTVYIGEKFMLEPTYSPSNAYSHLTWYCNSNTGALTLSGNIYTAVKEGKAEAYCTTDNGLTSNTCKISVIKRVPTSLKLSEESITIRKGKTAKLSATVEPTNADFTLSWNSSNPNIATVKDDGTIEAIEKGSATIYITTDNGLKASCTVNVTDNDFYFVVLAKSGSETWFALDTKPEITYQNSKFKVSSTMLKLEFSSDSIEKFYLYTEEDNTTTGIETPIAENDSFYSFYISKARPGSTVFIYDSSGHLVGDGIIDPQGNVEYSLETFPTGIYIIKTETNTFKVIKK